MSVNKLTSQFQAALAQSQSLAIGRDNAFIDPIHLMKALLEQENGTVKPLLTKSNVNFSQLQKGLDEAIERLPTVQAAKPCEIYPSNDLTRLLNVTDKLAQQRKDGFLSSELFVLAAVDDKNILRNLLLQSGAVKSAIETSTDEILGGAKRFVPILLRSLLK